MWLLNQGSDLSIAYETKLLWMCDNKQQATLQPQDWLSKLTASGIHSFHDNDYLNLRLLALHDYKVTKYTYTNL